MQVVSSILAGAAAGSLSGGSLADALGRRKTLMLSAVPMLLGPLMSAISQGLGQMIVGRVITGFAIGLSSTLVPLYISEVAPTSIRGALGTLNQVRNAKNFCFCFLLFSLTLNLDARLLCVVLRATGQGEVLAEFHPACSPVTVHMTAGATAAQLPH